MYLGPWQMDLSALAQDEGPLKDASFGGEDARCKIVREKMLNVEMFIYLLLTFTYKDMYDQT